jgi:hypothetical protein
MSLTVEQKNRLKDLLQHRDTIVSELYAIESLLKTYFPEEFNIAYQHWIPQIMTALYDDSRWLPRGQQNMEHSIKRIEDKINNPEFINITINRYI